MPCGAVQIFALGEKDSPLRALSNEAVEVLSHMLHSSGRGFGGYPMRRTLASSLECDTRAFRTDGFETKYYGRTVITYLT